MLDTFCSSSSELCAEAVLATKADKAESPCPSPPSETGSEH